MGVVQVVCIIARNRRQAVAVGVGIVLDEIIAVPNVCICRYDRVRCGVAPGLRPAQAAGVVTVGITDVPGGVGNELILRVVCVTEIIS